MTVNKRKKNSRARANTTHGWGAMKKHRGAGNRGGRGNSGSGKRGDQRKQYFESIDKDYFGKSGFKKKGQIEIMKTINIIDINQKIDNLVANKKATFENDVYSIDLKDICINKLLGKGNPEKKYKITVKYATKKAIEKIKSSGEIIIENVALEHTNK